MPITREEVDRVARLAKLDLAEDEKQRLADELDRIIGYVEKLNELDTENVDPTAHVMDLLTPLRDDRVEGWLTQEEALANAPAKKLGYFSVPKVIG